MVGSHSQPSPGLLKRTPHWPACFCFSTAAVFFNSGDLVMTFLCSKASQEISSICPRATHRLCRLQHFSVPLSSFLTLFSFILQAPARVASLLKVLPTQGLSPCSFLPGSGKFFHYVSHLHFIQGFLQVSLTHEASLGTLIQNIHQEGSLINQKDSLTALCFCLHCSSLPATVSLLAD